MVSYFALDATGETTNFQKEISNMMHGFGDNPKPNAATVVLVEFIVHQQLKTMVEEALQCSILRGSKTITNFDVIYQIRKNALKLRRLYDYQLKLDLIDQKCTLNISSTTNDQSIAIISGVILEDGDESTIIKKRRTHIDCIRQLDLWDEVTSIKYDAIDYLRKVRAAKITESMPFEKYEAYHKARCASFRSGIGLGKGYTKLERWLNPSKEFKLMNPALEVLCFIGHEIVAEIVDGVFLIRQDAKKRSDDTFSKFEGGHFCNPVSLSNAAPLKPAYEDVPAITVAEVREVLRRYFTPTTGMNGLFYRNMGMDLPVRYISH